MNNERPDGWIEPVHEALLRPPSFFGATPRNAVLTVHGAAALLLVTAARSRSLELAGAALCLSVLVQIGTAGLTYIEPHWFELLVEWLSSPQSKVKP